MPEASSIPQKYAVARLGAYLDSPKLNFLSGHEQVNNGLFPMGRRFKDYDVDASRTNLIFR